MARLAGPHALTEPKGKTWEQWTNDGHTSQTRVEERLKGDLEAFALRQDTQTGARGAARVLRHALRDSFTPRAGFVAALAKSAQARAQIEENKLTAFRRPSGTAVHERGIQPSMRDLGQATLTDPCQQSHEVARLAARVHVDHDAQGLVLAVTLQERSGQADFDAHAEAAARAAAARPLDAEAGEAQPLFTEWTLAQVVYDWASTPMCPPGAQRMPGTPVYPDAPNPWHVTFTVEVNLAAVRYRH